MKFKLYAIYDTVEKQGKGIFMSYTNESAIRYYNERVSKMKQAGIEINPADEKIAYLGTYETDWTISKDLDNRFYPEQPIEPVLDCYFLGDEPTTIPEEIDNERNNS